MAKIVIFFKDFKINDVIGTIEFLCVFTRILSLTSSLRSIYVPWKYFIMEKNSAIISCIKQLREKRRFISCKSACCASKKTRGQSSGSVSEKQDR